MGAASLAFKCPSKQGKKEEKHYEPQSAHDHRIHRQERRTKHLPNGTPVVKFSVATNKSWKDENDEWKTKTQWHNVIAFGKGFEQMTERLVKGVHVFVQGELNTREYERIIQVPNGKKILDHKVLQLMVELKADTVRILDRLNDSAEPSDAFEPPVDQEGPQ